MRDFWILLSQHVYLQHALLAGLLASVAGGVVGTFVTLRRIAYLGGAIAHCTLGGMGAVVYSRRVLGWTALEPLHGAIVAAVVGAVAIGLARHYGRQREDSLISLIWAVGMALGVIFLYKTPGYNQDLMSYLFGDILFVSKTELGLMATLDIVLLTLVVGFYQHLKAFCFDEEFAKLQGVRIEALSILLLMLAAVTVVLLVVVVGLVMAIALLTLPAAVACLFARRLWEALLGATAFSALAVCSGLWISYRSDLPTGAVIILTAAAGYCLLGMLKRLHEVYR